MNNEGKDLHSLLANEAEQVAAEVKATEPTASSDKMVPMNVLVPESLLKTLRLIAVHNDLLLRDIVTKEMTKYAKREKKKLMEQMLNDY